VYPGIWRKEQAAARVWLEPWAQGGALFSYGPDVNLLVLGAAAYVDKILKGAKPADLPVESQDAIADLLLEIARNPYSAHPKVTCPPFLLRDAVKRTD
jgi:hypothetical protein